MVRPWNRSRTTATGASGISRSGAARITCNGTFRALACSAANSSTGRVRSEPSTPAITAASGSGTPRVTTTGQRACALTAEITDPSSPATTLWPCPPSTIRRASRERSISAAAACPRTARVVTSTAGCVLRIAATAWSRASSMTSATVRSGRSRGSGTIGGAVAGHSSAWNTSIGAPVRTASSRAQSKAACEYADPSYPTTILLMAADSPCVHIVRSVYCTLGQISLFRQGLKSRPASFASGNVRRSLPRSGD